jgi:4-amino-4-deoxy-L-arabinose transferase-like glycosyltransferase
VCKVATFGVAVVDAGSMSESDKPRPRWVGLLGAALAAGGAALALWLQSSQVPADRGFVRERWAGAACSGTPLERTTLREPVQLQDAAQPAHCTRYRSHVAVDRLRFSELELDLRGRVQVWVDDRRVLDVRRDAIDASPRATLRLAPGVHTLTLEHQHPGGLGYLRVREHDTRDSHYRYVLPPLETARYFVSAQAAQGALAAGLPRPAAWRAPLAFALALISVLCGLRALGAARGSAPWLAWPDLWRAALLAGFGFAVRAAQLGRQDCTWDELAYAISGRHLLRNWQLGDFAVRAFRWNYPHPPLAKWIYGLAWELGGHDGGRLVSALLAGLSLGLLYAIGVRLFDRQLAVLAALTAAVLPHLVAHGRLTGLESPLVCFWNASLLAALVWVGPLGGAARPAASGPLPGAWSAAFLTPFWAVAAIATRMTAVWLLPLLLALLIYGSRRQGARLLRVPAAAWLGLGAALLLLVLGWSYLWEDPGAGWSRILTRWKGQHTTEFFLGRDRAPPPAGYYAAAFFATTPLAALGFGLAGLGLGWRQRALRPALVLCAAWLVLPFAQSVSSFRQDLARYVIPSWPVLALLAALGALELGRSVRSRFGLSGVAGALVGALPALLLFGDAALGLASVEPYPLGYFNAAVGGPRGVARARSFELASWGEGAREAIEWVNREAPRGSRVHLKLTPDDTPPRLRDDVSVVAEPRADYVLQTHYKFRARPPAGCTRAHRVTVAGAPLVDVYDCRARARAPG